MSAADPVAELNRGLNPAQREVATAPDGPTLVVAGAGSGKTRALVYRVANLVLRGEAPESILLLTFTRRAAQEMLRRASSLLDERCRRVAGGTFHAFAHQVLRRHARLVGYDERFGILDRGDATDLVGIVRTDLGLDRKGTRFPRKETLLDLFSSAVNTGRPIERLLADDYPQFRDDQQEIESVGRAYAERKRRHGVMDYDDLLLHLRDLVAGHDEVRRHLAATYRHLLLDEYQDTNRLQAHVAALLAAEHGRILVVGDEAQSIYSFRGADFRNIMDFPRIFPGAKTILLEQSYRSTQPILDLGNGILKSAREKFEKRLWSDLPGDSKPVLVRVADEHDEARFVAERVLELREEGVPLSEIAVLARAAWHSGNLEIELRQRNVPFRKFGGIKFVEAAHVKDVCAYLKVAANPRDLGSWFRILQLYEGVGPRTAQRIAEQILEAGGDVSVLTRPVLARAAYGRALATLAALVAGLADEKAGVAERLRATLEHYRPLLDRRYDDAAARSRDLDSLAAIAGRYASADAFLADLAIEPPEVARPGDLDDPEDEWLTLSTVHSAKGLEWHTVFVLDLVAGAFPAYPALRDPAAYEEERRLLYVAITRARRGLYLMKPEEVTRRGGAIDLAEMSPLLVDVPGFKRLVKEKTVSYAVESPDADATAGPSPSGTAQLKRIQDYFGS